MEQAGSVSTPRKNKNNSTPTTNTDTNMNTNSDTEINPETSIDTESDSNSICSLGSELDLEKTLTRHQTDSKTRPRAHEMLLDVSYHTVKIAKHALDIAIWLPHDLTLSLSKGFHNLPKMYHDRTVRDTPRVLGLRGGFRAAGTVSLSLFLSSFTLCSN